MKSDSAPVRGQWAEEFAHRYLCEQGLTPITRNYRCKAGEIDLIMQHQAHLVFVEVRYRQSRQYGGAGASIDSRKQQRIAQAAAHYLQTYRQAQQFACRFDVVLMEGKAEAPRLEWVRDAFWL